MIHCLVLMQLTGMLAAGPTTQVGADHVVLQNAHVSLAFSRAQKGGLVSFFDKHAGREMLAQGAAQRLFTLALSQRVGKPGQPIYVSSTDARSVKLSLRHGPGGAQTVDAAFHDLGGRGIDCRLTASLGPSDGFVRWRLASVRLPDALVLDQVQCPILVLRSPLGKATDSAVIGQTKGGLYLRPSAWKPNETISAAQPGSMAAQFGCYYDAAGGLYTAAEDSRGYPKSLWMRRTADGLEVAWGESCFAAPTFAMDYDVITAPFASPDSARPTDWRDAADLYKAWAVKQPWCAKRYLDRPDIPSWLKDGPAMVRFTRDWLAQPDQIERWLREYWLKRFPPHTPLIVAYWGWEKVNTWVSPDYFPVFPSDQAFRRLAAMNHSIGGHVFLWPSGYHYTLTYGARKDSTFQWDDRARFKREFEAHAIVNRDGSIYRVKPSWLDGGEMSCLCPGDPWTINFLNGIAEQLVDRGADIIQMDQVVGGSFPPCYSTKHGHPRGPGLWMAQVFHKQLRTMVARCRKINPQTVVCFEEPNEHFLQQVAIQDYRDLEKPWQGPKPVRASVFNYLYHEYLPTFQSNPRRGDKRTEAYCLVNGEIPHLVPTREIGPGPLLDNGGFEEWSGNVPTGWTKVAGYQGQVFDGPCARDTDVKHGGDASLRLGPVADGQIVQVSRNLPIGGTFAVGQRYRLSAWIRTRGVLRSNQIMLGTFTSDFKLTGTIGGLRMPAEAEGWVRRETTFTVAPASALLRIMLHLVGPGTAWIDDIKLEQVHADGTTAEVMRPEVPPDYQLMRRWVALYSGVGRPYLEHGRMLHPPKLEIAGNPPLEADGQPALLYNAYRAPDGSEAVVLVNATDVRHTAALTWHGRRRSLTLRPWEVRLIR